MNRRAFLGTLLAAAPVLALDPERLLWVPGQKTIFIPEAVGVHRFVTPEWVARESLLLLRNTLRFANEVNRVWAEPFTVGDAIRIHAPATVYPVNY